jgi:hypothetical protein
MNNTQRAITLVQETFGSGFERLEIYSLAQKAVTIFFVKSG